MSEPLSEVTPTKKMKQSRLPFQVLLASSPQPAKKRKLSGEDAGNAGSVPKSPRSSGTTADVENIPITVSLGAEASSTKKAADSAEIPKKGVSIKTFFHKTTSGAVKEEGSPKQQVKKEVVVVIDDNSLESLPQGQEQANKSQDASSPTSVEKEDRKVPGEPLSSTPSCSADASECSANASDSDNVADAVDTTDTSCRETSFQSEEPGSTPCSQEASPTALCDKPDGKETDQDASASEPSGKEVDGKVPKAAKSAKPVQTLTKAEREKQRQEKLAERERQRKERAEQKAKREEEKLAKQKLREENRLRKQQLLEELSKQKEERKRAKQEELQKKEEEKQKKEEERQKREEEKQKKEEERQKKEEERLRKEEEKKRAKEEQASHFLSLPPSEKKQQKEKAVFANFFVKRTEPKQASKGGGEGGVGAFRPFQLKEGMTLAPFVPQDVLQRFNGSALDHLLQAQASGTFKKGWLARRAFSRRTLQTRRRQEQHPRAKLLQFCENVRPAYWGTWRKKSQAVSGRHPWGKEKELDYEVDSEEEWEEEEPGESLSGTEDEKESEDDYEVDNDVFVPHGYLSEDEEKGDDDPMSPETLKARLKLRQEELQAELRGGTARPLRPLVVGCIWQALGPEPGQQGLGCLDQFAAVRLTLSFRPSWEVREEALQKSAAPLPDAALSLLASLVHNRAVKKAEVMQEFGSTWDGAHVPRKKLLEALQGLGAQRSGGRWLLAPETLERLGLSHLALPVPAVKEPVPKAAPKAMPPGPLERFLSSATKEDKANQSRQASPARKTLLLVKPQMPTALGPGSFTDPIILEEESEDAVVSMGPPDEAPASSLAEAGPHAQKTTLCT
ncbi:unnamed protein product [Ixodes hexagonus]